MSFENMTAPAATTEVAPAVADATPKRPRSGFVHMPKAVMSLRDQVALRLMQSLVMSVAPTSRRGQKDSLAIEAFEMADAFIAASKR